MKSVYTIADQLAPLQSPNSDMAFAYIYDGNGKLAEGANYIDSIEQTPEGPKRNVRWNFDGESKATFRADEIQPAQLKPLFANGEALTFEQLAERITKAKTTARPDISLGFGDFRRIWLSQEFRDENPFHPVSVLKARRDALYEFRGWLRSVKPLLCIRKNGKTLFMDKERCSPEKQAKLLEALG